ncbi:MAG TPA: methyltransferase domain-containing protein [Longimicrobium sp.]|jgi:2-polyprenyl-3-methyl-5-hydroxy-6-metoxy-1,4-benzoquinol methylase|uniref:class I SAM-dependent methyltransferase n=1 Tax=Longimicrobium sp. TaxID=2029185 RepID=UPI002EDBAC54
MTKPWPELYTGGWTVTGNVGKVKVQHELRSLIDRRPDLRVLDIGCIGPQPLDFWRPLLEGTSFHLTGVDVADIERGMAVVREQGWGSRVSLHTGSGYGLTDLFSPDSFDALVATQVLEHVARLDLFMKQVGTVVRPGGDVFFTLDSAHWLSRFTPSEPVRLAKNVVKKALSVVGRERHYDLPWFDHEVEAACRRAGLEVVSFGYYNIPELKYIYGQVLPPAERNAFAQRWFELEDALNARPEVRERARHCFLVLYVHARRRA